MTDSELPIPLAHLRKGKFGTCLISVSGYDCQGPLMGGLRTPAAPIQCPVAAAVNRFVGPGVLELGTKRLGPHLFAARGVPQLLHYWRGPAPITMIESEAAYLKRHGLLTDREAARLSATDFRPEPVLAAGRAIGELAVKWWTQ